MLFTKVTKGAVPILDTEEFRLYGSQHCSYAAFEALRTNHISSLIDKITGLIMCKPIHKIGFMLVLFFCLGVADVIAYTPVDETNKGNTLSNKITENATGNESKSKAPEGVFDETQKPVGDGSKKPSKHDVEFLFTFMFGFIVALIFCFILFIIETIKQELAYHTAKRKSNNENSVFLPSGEVPSTVRIKGKYGEVSVSSVFGGVPTSQALRVYLGLVKTETGKSYLSHWDEVYTEEEFKKEFKKSEE